MSTIGERVRELRESLDMTRDTFGERFGVSRDVVNNLERDRVNITDARLLHISRTFGVCYAWLKTGEGPMYPPESDDEIEQFARIMEGSSEAKKELMRFILSMPDHLVDQMYEYYTLKAEERRKAQKKE